MNDSNMTSCADADVGIYGCYPPPYGGIGIHVKRLLPLLARSGISYRVYNGVGDFADPPRIVNITRSKLSSGLEAILCGRHRVYYVLSTRTSTRFWAGLMATAGKRVVLHIDGASLHKAVASPRRRERWISYFAVRRVWGLVGVNESIRQLAANIRGSDRRVWSIPAYLRPGQPDASAVEPEVRQFVELHGPTLLAMGRFAEIGGREVYGLPELIDLLVGVRRQHPAAGLIFALTHPEDLDGPMWPTLKARIEQLGLAEHFRIRLAKSELVPLMASCAVMVRPSSTDGDSVAVREALYCGLPVVASDCVPRPKGTILHRTGDSGQMVERVLWVLSHRQEAADALRDADVSDYWPALQAVFAEALGRRIG